MGLRKHRDEQKFELGPLILYTGEKKLCHSMGPIRDWGQWVSRGQK